MKYILTLTFLIMGSLAQAETLTYSEGDNLYDILKQEVSDDGKTLYECTKTIRTDNNDEYQEVNQYIAYDILEAFINVLNDLSDTGSMKVTGDKNIQLETSDYYKVIGVTCTTLMSIN